MQCFLFFAKSIYICKKQTFIDGIFQSFKNSNIDYIWKGTVNGAIGGTVSTLAVLSVFGPAYEFKDYDFIGIPDNTPQPIYRKGGISNLIGYGGINIGRTSWAKDGDNGIFVHEGTYWKQQTEDGFGKFYGQIFIDYATHILRYGDINAIYTTNGSYDNLANEIETNYKNR